MTLEEMLAQRNRDRRDFVASLGLTLMLAILIVSFYL